MKVRVDKGRAKDAQEVHVEQDAEQLLEISSIYCFKKAAEVLRSKTLPTSVYNGVGGNNVYYITNTQEAKAWIELGKELRYLEEEGVI